MSSSPSPNNPTANHSASSADSRDTVPAWHAGFLKLLPAILRRAQIEFQPLRAEAREEAIQEVIVNAMAAYARLVKLGKEQVAFATPLARFAIAQYRTGRLVSTPLNCRDVTSFYCQRRNGLVVERLDHWDERGECWREVLVEDRTCGPAELASSRIDFAHWMASLPPRNRRIAKLLAAGERTLDVARRARLCPARISQLRRELKRSWLDFHGDEAEHHMSAVVRTAC